MITTQNYMREENPDKPSAKASMLSHITALREHFKDHPMILKLLDVITQVL
jgi:hypothetical protein